MAFLAFDGDRVAAVNSANDDGSGGVDLELDTDRDLDGSGNPYYSPTSKIVIEIDDADIGPNGEFQQGGSDGEVTVLSIKVDGVEILSDTDKIKFGGGGDTFEGDGYFFVEGVKLFFLSPIYTETFSDAAMDGGKLVLNVPDRVSDNDFNDNSKIDSGTTEVGNGVFNIQTSNVVCFAGGTMNQTPNGEVPVEALEVGDSVETLDHGPRKIRLVVRRELSFPEAPDKQKPIEFKPGSLGVGLPKRALCVSPQHRVLVSDPSICSEYGVEECLVPAKGLLKLKGVRKKAGCRKVSYHHLVFDRHEIVFSEGVATESMFPGPVALQSMDRRTLVELLEIFPELRSSPDAMAERTARKCPRAGEVARIIQASSVRSTFSSALH